MTGGAVPGVSVSLQELLALRKQPGNGRIPRLAQTTITHGSHAVPQRARGIEFAEVRPYQPGDDARAIDWRQTARRGHPYTRLFQQEHERPLRLLVDMGPSMRFATRGAYKSVIAARAAAWLAWQAVAVGDRVGGMAWGVAEQQEVRPLGRHHGTLKLLQQIARASQSDPVTTVLADVLRSMRPTLRPGTQVWLLSDFSGLDAVAEREIMALSLQAELRLIHIYDIFEKDPLPGCYLLSDDSSTLALDLTSAEARAAYSAGFLARLEALRRLGRRIGTPLTSLATHDDPARQLGWMMEASPPRLASA
mgnify:CR=1 FL=1